MDKSVTTLPKQKKEKIVRPPNTPEGSDSEHNTNQVPKNALEQLQQKSQENSQTFNELYKNQANKGFSATKQ